MIAAAFRAGVGCDIAVEFIAHATWTAGQFFVAERFGTAAPGLPVTPCICSPRAAASA